MKRIGIRSFRIELNYKLLYNLKKEGKVTPLEVGFQSGNGALKANIYVILLQLIHFEVDSVLSVDEHLTEAQSEAIVELIINDYGHLSLEDLKLFFQRILAGDFGPHYGKLDPPRFGEWLRQFEVKRMTANAKFRREEEEARESARMAEHKRRMQTDAVYRANTEQAREKFLDSAKDVLSGELVRRSQTASMAEILTGTFAPEEHEENKTGETKPAAPVARKRNLTMTSAELSETEYTEEND